MSSETPPPSPGPTVILRGHLHPAVLVLRLLEALQRSGFLLLLGLFADRIFLVAAAVVFLAVLGSGLVRYLTFQYVLTADELVTREGILHRQERRIPIDRVQDLGFESTLLRRAMRIAVVRVETASGQGAEAMLDSLGRFDAERLRELLLQLRAARTAADSSAAVAMTTASVLPLPIPEPEWTVFVVQPGWLLLRGITDLRLGAILVAAIGGSQLIDQLGLLTRLRGVGDSFLAWLHAFPLALAALVLLGIVALVLAGSIATSAIGNLMVFYAFRLTLRADTLQCRYGLLTTRQKALPRRRVQRVRVEQTWLRRLLGFATARADSAGGGRDTADEAPGGFDVVVPLAPLERVDQLLPALLPGIEATAPPLRPSPRLVLRVFGKGAIWLATVAATTAPLLGWGALWFAAALPLPWLYGRLAWQSLGYALWPRHLFLQWGLLGRYRVLVPTGKVQAVALQQGPLQRVFGLCDLLVYVAGGPATRLPDLAPEQAQPMLRELAIRAAAAASLDWRPRRSAPASVPGGDGAAMPTG